MKKFSVFFALIMVLFALTSCTDEVSPFQTRYFEAATSKQFSVYVCGAVENEGYVNIFEGTDYQTLIFSAGYIPQTVMTSTPYAVVNSNVSSVVLRYFDGTKACDCTNLNGAAIADRMSIENVSEVVVEKIAAFTEVNGKITDRTQLKQILGDDYAENFYKFFVSESDYEKID